MAGIFEQGGAVPYVIVACSIVAMNVAIERWIFGACLKELKVLLSGGEYHAG